MTDNLTPRERAEKALEAAGFVEGHYFGGLTPSIAWMRDGAARECTERVKFFHNYKKPGYDNFELIICGDVEDIPTHLLAYLNAKELLAACEAAEEALVDAELHLWEGAAKTKAIVSEVLAEVRNAIAKVEGKA